jgi:hypothetical protein
MRPLIRLALGAIVVLAAGCTTTTVQGPEGQKMTVLASGGAVVHRGGSEAVEITIDRKNFTGPVEVTLSELPQGVKADQDSKTVATNKATFLLTVSDSADLVQNQAVKITVKGPGDMETTQYLKLSVKQ